MNEQASPLFTLPDGKRPLRAASGQALCQVPGLRVDITGPGQVKLGVMLPEATDTSAFTWHERYAAASWLPEALAAIERDPEGAFEQWFGWARPARHQSTGTSHQAPVPAAQSAKLSAEDLGL